MAVSDIRRVIDLHRRQLFGLTEIRGVQKLRPSYERARADLERKLKALVRAGKGDTFGAHHMRIVLAQVAAAVHEVRTGIVDRLEDTGRTAADLAPRHLVQAVEVLQDNFRGVTPVLQPRQAAVFQAAYPDVAPSLLDRYRASSELYGAPVVKAVRDQMTQSILQGEGVDDAVDRVAGTSGIFDGERWRAERIVRTESAYSYGVAKQVGMEELRKDVPRLQKRLVATLDERTGRDSIDLNGQTVDVDKPFLWVVKNSHGVPTGKVVHYMQPPNRPNDREIVIPWEASWPASPVLDSMGPVDPSTRGL